MAQPPPLVGLIQWNSFLVPDPTDSQDMTGGGLPRPYEVGPKWKFKFGNSSQDDVHNTESMDQSSKVAQKCYRDGCQDTMFTGLSKFEATPQDCHQKGPGPTKWIPITEPYEYLRCSTQELVPSQTKIPRDSPQIPHEAYQSSLSGMPDTDVDDWTKSMEYREYKMNEVTQWSRQVVLNWPAKYESGLWQPATEAP
ncbi:hypothetical protein BS47DRAFT_1367394 [Hydnum rufescens UP504]|uniref:Uncharacterized protein n=1 Tax=Hydnum rufescens UP504 TaxID=1448309 RepID=A0A9P6AIH0_9AGAM|nr:hypothetical protein BS47DRAFT_1367394 [Hydnum rufescens UP504]